MTKLFTSRTSPYGRKALVVAHEKGLIDQIEVVQVDPWTDPPALLASTPIGKVPALVLDDGGLMTESTLICDYLDSQGSGPSLLGADRFAVLARTALAQGLIDAAVATVIELRRPAERQWDGSIARQRRVIDRTLAAVTAPERFDLAGITLACALAYLDFRLPATDWRGARSDLAAWLDEVAQRPSMQATRP